MKNDSMSDLTRRHSVPLKHLGIPQTHLVESLSPNHRRYDRFATRLVTRLIHTLHSHIKKWSTRKLKKKRSEMAAKKNFLLYLWEVQNLKKGQLKK